MQLASLIYICEARESLTSFELEKIVKSGNRQNLSNNVTSFMILIDEVLIQIIEGEANKADAAYKNMQDNIHLCNFSLIFRKEILKRSFDKWSLGYHVVTSEDIASLEEFRGLDKKGFFEKLRSNLEEMSQQLLYHFYQQKVHQYDIDANDEKNKIY